MLVKFMKAYSVVLKFFHAQTSKAILIGTVQGCECVASSICVVTYKKAHLQTDFNEAREKPIELQ
jgi:hypothetical protein